MKSYKDFTSIVPLEVPHEIPEEIKNSDSRVHSTDTAEGVIGDITEFEEDPMNIKDLASNDTFN